jgi:phosphatidylserine decarboxylase
MTIHKEGRVLLLVLLIVFAAINYVLMYVVDSSVAVQNTVLITSIVLYVIVLQFFRNPIFNITTNEDYVLAPADGKVVVIEDTEENEHFNDKRKQISIFMSPINVHVNRSPVAGTVKKAIYHPGKYLVAWDPKSSTENERTTIVMQMRNGTEVLFRQIAGALARRIKYYVKEGDELGQG